MTIHTAEIVLPCRDLDPALAFFGELGFRIEAVFPADDPRVAVLVGHGVRLRLEPGDGPAGTLRLACDDPAAVASGRTSLIAPNGTRVELVAVDPPLQVPPLRSSLVITPLHDDTEWKTGRAGMLYRDLIPGRQGGRFIASHIRIPEGGPVPDYVHYHRVRFQMIYCYRGWVRLVYEDQGPPFVMRAGDCVLQPPLIRHRVLECSPGLEVIEIGCPAEHETRADHDLTLPTDPVRPERDFSGQRFVRHQADSARWIPWRLPGFECRDTGIAAATAGLASARVVRRVRSAAAASLSHGGELLFLFVLEGSLTLRCDPLVEQPLGPGAAVVVPAHTPYELISPSADLELLEVALPAAAQGFAS